MRKTKKNRDIENTIELINNYIELCYGEDTKLRMSKETMHIYINRGIKNLYNNAEENTITYLTKSFLKLIK